MAYNKLQSLRDNIAAIKLAHDITSNERLATPDEIDTLRKYSGFGGIKEVLELDKYIKAFDISINEKERTEFTTSCIQKGEDHIEYNLYCLALQIGVMSAYKDENGKPELDFKKAQQITNSIKQSVLTAFYTPQEVIASVRDAVHHVFHANGIKAASFLETSAGIGGFLPVAMAGSKQVAFEIDPISAMVGAALHPEADWVCDGFETIDSYKEALGTPHFDVIASNIPFAQVNVFDKAWLSDATKHDTVHQSAKNKLHTYFFVKALEQLENGGILAFVTTRGIADSESNAYLRRWLVENGNLLAAVRLPDNLFMDGSGIEVGSDLIIFQRDIHKKMQTTEEEFFTQTVTKQYRDNGNNSSLIEVGPANRLLSVRQQSIYTQLKVGKNQFGDKTIFHYYWRDGMDKFQAELTARLNRDLERNFRKSAWLYGHDTLRKSMEATMQRNAGKQSGLEKARQTREQNKQRLADMTEPYNTVLKAFTTMQTYERIHRQSDAEGRDRLNHKYDMFVQQFGTFHQNEELIRQLPEHQLMLSLEVRGTDKQYHKADVFDHPTAFRVISADTVLTPMEALSMSMNEFGGVNMSYIRQLTHMATDEEVYASLKGDIFLVDGHNWLHKSHVINGDVISKRKSLEDYIRSCGQLPEFVGKCYDDTITALRNATPTPIAYEDIDIQLGVRWLPVQYFERFSRHIFHHEYKITYTAANDMFLVENKSGYSYDDEGNQFGKYRVYCEASQRRYDGYEILGFALIDKCPEITYTRREIKFTDHEGMQLVQKKIDQMRREFLEFMQSKKITPEERLQIEQLYNEKFNCYVRAQFDGSMQTFPGLDFSQLGFSDLYQSQKDCIAMLKANHGGVAWHTVGGGKTMIMCVTAYEMHRLGLCNKPVIIGLKANVHQIAETFRKAYPTGRLLYPGKDDFTKANRVEFFNKIANNDWDCIIMTHDQFSRIPLTPDVEDELINRELSEIDEALRVMHLNNCNGKISRKQVSGLEVRKKNLLAKREEAQEKRRQKADDVLNFRQLGIDFIMVDEYQQFKNLAFTTRHGRVAGLGNSAGSSRASHLFTCIRDIQWQTGRDMCAAFFSGTIITNALTELYVLFKYLCPHELERQGISCFDSWAAVYIHKSNEIELDLCNNLKEKERFRTYLNVPELKQALRSITDYRSAEMINLDIPTRNDIYDLDDPTPQQEVMLERLQRFASSGDWDVLGLPSSLKSDNLDKSVMLVATNLARKIALDPRLLDKDLFHDEPNNKAHRCAKRLYENYMEFNEHRGTQFVFTDLSSYDKSKWNICAEIRDILVQQYGIPSQEITFINLHESARAKAKLFDDMNAGRIRIIFGSTQKLGTGVNAQQRAVAVHHLDAPWRPADLEQRDGRAVRHGNEVKLWAGNEVRIYTYGTKKTLDSFKYNLIHAKQNFISSIALDTTISRHLDEDSINEEDGISYAELKALLSGNEDLLKIAKLERKVNVLRTEHDNFQRQHTHAEQQLERDEKDINMLTASIEKAEQEQNYIANHLGECFDPVTVALNTAGDINKIEVPANVLRLFDAKNQTVEELGRVIKQINFQMPKQSKVIGEYCGMPIMAFIDGGSGSVAYAVQTVSNRLRRGNDRGCNNASFADSLRYFDGVYTEVSKVIASAKSSLSFAENDKRSQQIILSQEWDGTTELMRLEAELDELTTAVKADLAAKEREREENALKEAESK